MSTTTTRYLTVIYDDLVADLEDADAIHRQTMALFASAKLPGDSGARRSGSNILWRHENVGVLVSSDIPATDLPDASVTEVETFTFASGERHTFLATVDITVRVKGRDLPSDDVAGWLERKTAGALRGVRITSASVASARRRGHRFEQVTVMFEGEVQDESALADLLRRGIGRSKTFGCGLLTPLSVEGDRQESKERDVHV